MFNFGLRKSLQKCNGGDGEVSDIKSLAAVGTEAALSSLGPSAQSASKNFGGQLPNRICSHANGSTYLLLKATEHGDSL